MEQSISKKKLDISLARDNNSGKCAGFLVAERY